MELKIGVVIHDATMERYGVVIDARPLNLPEIVTVRWEPLGAGLVEELDASVFTPLPRYRVIS